MRKKHIYTGDAADVSWDGRLCIHIGECGRAEGDLFVGGRDPWCQPNVVDNSNVDDVVRRCPTGALTYTLKDGSQGEQADAENVLVVSNDGPLYVRGDLEVEGAPDDMEGIGFRVALCRCGASKNKPFCDNSHIEAGFRDHGAVGESGKGFDSPGGKLTIKSLDDGPVIVNGNLSIIAASGRVAWRGTKAALCRCGASKNKPFCDGTHRSIGFTTK